MDDDVTIYNMRQVKKDTKDKTEAIQGMIAFLTFVLLVLSVYQLVLSIDEGLMESKFAIGVLRAMGIK